MPNQNKRVPVRRVTVGKMHTYRGKELKILPQPPEFTSRPWFGLTVRIEDVSTTLGAALVVSSIRSQLGWPADVPLDIRLETIKIYGPLVSFSTGPLVALNVAFQDFIAENSLASGVITGQQRIIEQFTRYPDQVNRACVGFRYGIAHSSITLSSTTGNDVLLCNLTGAGAGSLAMVRVLFRTATISPASVALPQNSTQPGWFSR